MDLVRRSKEAQDPIIAKKASQKGWMGRRSNETLEKDGRKHMELKPWDDKPDACLIQSSTRKSK